jgi:hypothetical protein
MNRRGKPFIPACAITVTFNSKRLEEANWIIALKII